VNNINWTVKILATNRSQRFRKKYDFVFDHRRENAKGYGQDLFLFGYKKGSGESIWDIKKANRPLFDCNDRFVSKSHTLEQMILSGFLTR
jgi:hypothetical protein